MKRKVFSNFNIIIFSFNIYKSEWDYIQNIGILDILRIKYN